MTPTIVIAVDCRPLIDTRISGVSTYTIQMIKALKDIPNLKLQLFYQNGERAEHLHELFPDINWIKASSLKFHLRSFVWRSELPDAYFQKQPDLIWLPDRRPFYKTKIPLVMTIHDMVPERVSGSLSWRSRIWHKVFSTHSLLKNVDGVITPSFSVEQEIPRNIPRRVTYEGSSLKGKGVLPNSCPKNFSLMISPQDPRKRTDWFLRLAKEFPKDDFVWAGVKENDPRFASLKPHITPNLHLLGEVSELEKIGLLRATKCLYALSEYEGFDLPVLEAVGLKCPVIMSDIPVHVELYTGVNFVSNFDDLRSEYLRSRQQKMPIPKTRGVYTWESAARTALLFFRRVVQNKNR